jgi:hypothetical protein
MGQAMGKKLACTLHLSHHEERLRGENATARPERKAPTSVATKVDHAEFVGRFLLKLLFATRLRHRPSQTLRASRAADVRLIVSPRE